MLLEFPSAHPPTPYASYQASSRRVFAPFHIASVLYILPTVIMLIAEYSNPWIPAAPPVSDLIRYISTNEEQMRYDVFRQKGYDIGSIAVEGACKYVVGKRLKQSGMIWSRSGSSSVLALRITWLNKRWEQLWENRPLVA